LLNCHIRRINNKQVSLPHNFNSRMIGVKNDS